VQYADISEECTFPFHGRNINQASNKQAELPEDGICTFLQNSPEDSIFEIVGCLMMLSKLQGYIKLNGRKHRRNLL
jgi:hypothetical protein